MIKTSLEVEGLDDLKQQLLGLVNDAVSKQQVQSALMYASNPMVKAMKDRAPIAEAAYFRYYRGSAKQRRRGNAQASRRQVQPGTLRKAIARKRVRLERSVGVAIFIRNRAFYWRFLEYGTPRMAAKPFIRNSFDNNAELSLARFKQKLRANIDKIKAKQQIAQTSYDEAA